MFVGYGDQVKGYIVYIPSKNKLIASRNVKFFENQPYFGSNSTDKSNNFDEDDGEMVVLPLLEGTSLDPTIIVIYLCKGNSLPVNTVQHVNQVDFSLFDKPT
jgi:hypothetical protein